VPERLYADGQSIVFAARALGTPLPERVAGVDLMLELLQRGSTNRWRVFLLGATDEVLSDVSDVISQRFSGVVLAGTRNGYFSADLDSEVAAEISETSADLVLVAMPSPRKETWVNDHGLATGASVIMGVGGSLDVLSGHVKRAPEFLQRAGFEWAWRVAQEPRRLWRRYAQSNARFIAGVIREMRAKRQAR
jgi:N-acetylglucosaminyldiphosphoundecaprenol N-acetyl-beta-D-mannosaminyltransferase